MFAVEYEMDQNEARLKTDVSRNMNKMLIVKWSNMREKGEVFVMQYQLWL